MTEDAARRILEAGYTFMEQQIPYKIYLNDVFLTEDTMEYDDAVVELLPEKFPRIYSQYAIDIGTYKTFAEALEVAQRYCPATIPKGDAAILSSDEYAADPKIFQ